MGIALRVGSTSRISPGRALCAVIEMGNPRLPSTITSQREPLPQPVVSTAEPLFLLVRSFHPQMLPTSLDGPSYPAASLELSTPSKKSHRESTVENVYGLSLAIHNELADHAN